MMPHSVSSTCTDKTLKELISPVEERKANVQAYVEEVRPDISYQIVTLHDPFGPTVTDESLECLVVSEETTKGGDSINHRRVEKVCHLLCSSRYQIRVGYYQGRRCLSHLSHSSQRRDMDVYTELM